MWGVLFMTKRPNDKRTKIHSRQGITMQADAHAKTVCPSSERRPPPPFLSSIVEWFTTCQTLGVWIGILDDYKSYENSP